MKTVMPDGYSVNHKDLSFDPIARLGKSIENSLAGTPQNVVNP